jgi:rod shape-determining protein MreD
MKNVVHLAFGLALLVLQGALATLVPMHPFVPSLLLPMAIHLGVDPDVPLVRGAALSFVLGYFADEVASVPTGLTTFVLVATFLATRGAGIRLMLRGVSFQMGLAFGASILASGTMLALRAIFQPPEAFPLVMPPAGALGWLVRLVFGEGTRTGSAVAVASTMIASALATALVSPLVFAATRRIEGLAQRARRSSTAGGETVAPP